MAPMSGSINALIAAASDYSELTTGHRVAGAFFACSSVGIKVGTGLGTAVSGFIIDAAVRAATAIPGADIPIFEWGYLLPILLFPIMTLLVLSGMDVEKKTDELRLQKGE